MRISHVFLDISRFVPAADSFYIEVFQQAADFLHAVVVGMNAETQRFEAIQTENANNGLSAHLDVVIVKRQQFQSLRETGGDGDKFLNVFHVGKLKVYFLHGTILLSSFLLKQAGQAFLKAIVSQKNVLRNSLAPVF